MTQYNVTGMSCAACSARVEKAVSRVPGVTSCSVSLLTNSMGVEGSAAPQDIIAAVQAAGYGASLKGAGKAAPSAAEAEAALEDHETPKLKRRLLWSLGFLLVLMYFSMGHMMWGWPLPAFYTDNHVAMGLTQLLLTVAVMVINQKFFISGFQSLWRRAPNMDTLVALGATAAFGYSTYALFAMTGAQVRGDTEAVMTYMMDFYFESAAMILTLITVGKMLEARSKGRTTDALKGLMKLAPQTATVERDGRELEVPIEQVQKDDIFAVRHGDDAEKPTVFAEQQRRFAVLRKRLAARPHGGGDLRRGGNVGETAAAERLPVPHGGQPAAGERPEVRDLIRGQAVGLRPGEDRAGERMLAFLLERERRAKQLRFAYTICGKKLGDLRLARSDGAGLVQRDDVHAARLLQRRGGFE